MKKIIVALILLFNSSLMAQNCSVLVDSLKGNYVGECQKGIANGYGTAIGIHTYVGNFKNGYPDGKGKYLWENGNWYDGFWVKGLFEGEGTLHLAKTKTSDTSELKGFWVKGKFKGVHKSSFAVDVMSNKINEVNIREVGKTGEDITIIVKSITGGALTVMGGGPMARSENTSELSNTIPKPKLTDMQVLMGSYLSRFDDEYSPIANKYTLKHVVFPISFFLSFNSERIKVDIFEKGNWTIDVKLDK